ncbi:hypothetical protein PR202_gb29660 [Eleusine coracana subsp. coracana]|uniref:Protein kinase domain-containing protein n=1 Tax=Eleusine coracana subsp. coracana TaxID=191504 RepID=A0AAV5FZY8_ELECO|nr:hypothetical protein PR202_gb29660 [Eleusine coracana subsp. coracana]
MEPKITDFGLSRFINDKVTTIVTKNTPGTLGYMAPEVIVSQELSLRADIYSLGIIMKQVITGYNKIIDLEKVRRLKATKHRGSFHTAFTYSSVLWLTYILQVNYYIYS